MRVFRSASVLGILSVAFASSVLSMSAEARTVNATAGIAGTNTVASCFTVSFITGTAGVTNSCAAAATYAIPLIVDVAGVRTVLVTGKAETGGSLVCQVFTYTFNGNLVTSTASQTWTPGGGYQQKAFSSVNVPAGGTGYVYCSLSGSNRARVNVIDYAP